MAEVCRKWGNYILEKNDNGEDVYVKTEYNYTYNENKEFLNSI